jgi:hypothetical protein
LYIETQPADKRKLGFGTKDASKTDEFTNAIRTEQYRSMIRKEKDMMKKTLESASADLEKLLATHKPEVTSKYSEPCHLYDIGRTRINEYSQKVKKDSYYKANAFGEKHLGPYKPTSADAGWDPWNYEYKPPANGGDAANSVRTFYDKSHLKVGGGSY